jgi:hypothetical protein
VGVINDLRGKRSIEVYDSENGMSRDGITDDDVIGMIYDRRMPKVFKKPSGRISGLASRMQRERDTALNLYRAAPQGGDGNFFENGRLVARVRTH